MLELWLRLEARNPTANVWRRFEIWAGRDLWGPVVVTRRGRIGAPFGEMRTEPAMTRDALLSLVRQHIRRRASAPRRIGVAYRIVVDACPEEISAQVILGAPAARTISSASTREVTR
jgi:hypothetical protein